LLKNAATCQLLQSMQKLWVNLVS